MKKKNDLNRKQRFAVPDAYIIIFGIVLLVAIATYIIPAGSYERETVDNITKVVPGTYELVESSPTTLLDLFLSIQIGMIESAPIIFLVFMIGGMIQVMQSTGAIDSGVNALVNKTKGNYMLLITIVITVFSILSTFGIPPNVALAFIPIGIKLASALNLDRMTGFVTAYLGFGIGFLAGIADPVVVGFAQTLAELPMFSGIWLRIVLFFVILIVSLIYVLSYAKKVKKDPTKSIMGKEHLKDDELKADKGPLQPFTRKHQLIIFTFFLFIAIFLYGAFNHGWGLNELSAIFIMLAVVIAIIDRISPNKFIAVFMEGAKSIAYGALVVGLARTVVVVMENGYILDTIVNAALVPLQSASLYVGGVLLYLFNAAFNLLVVSGSGQASIVMPLMTPIGDLMGLTRQTTVFLFKLGDGVSNMITPTAGGLMAALAVGRINFIKWFRFIFPLSLIWIFIAVIFAIVAIAVNYGPY